MVHLYHNYTCTITTPVPLAFAICFNSAVIFDSSLIQDLSLEIIERFRIQTKNSQILLHIKKKEEETNEKQPKPKQNHGNYEVKSCLMRCINICQDNTNKVLQ